MASTPGRDPHRRIAGMQHAALIAAIMAAVTFAIMFLFDLPWLGAAVVVFSGIAWILLKPPR